MTTTMMANYIVNNVRVILKAKGGSFERFVFQSRRGASSRGDSLGCASTCGTCGISCEWRPRSEDAMQREYYIFTGSTQNASILLNSINYAV